MKRQFVQAIFCAPTGAYDDKTYPSRLTDEVFENLKQAGINRIFGFGYDGRMATIEKTFELCEKYGIRYYPTPRVQGDYVRVVEGECGEKPYCEMSEAEKQDLDERFLEELQEMARHPAFGGVFFTDEAGYLSFEGIARAKKVFDRRYHDFEFHTNFYSYSINDAIFWGGMAGIAPERLPFQLTGDMEITFTNRFTYYDCLVEGLLSKANFEFVSQDKYPFEEFWPTVPTSVHVALFELSAYFNEKKKKYDNKFYNYMQVGQWFPAKREMTFAEMALQMNVTAAYGSDGFAYFPGCFPIDYVGEPEWEKSAYGGSSLIDLDGKPTIYCEWVTRLNQFFRQIEGDILSSELLGVSSYGNYQNGFNEEEIRDLLDNECIFRGELPDMLRYQSELEVESDNEVMVSAFERDGKKRYYLTNVSTVYPCNITVQWPEGKYEMIFQKEREIRTVQERFTLEPGCGVYVIEQ